MLSFLLLLIILPEVGTQYTSPCIARENGWTLNEYGFAIVDSSEKGRKSKKVVICKTEEDIYKAVGLNYVEPELREI